MVNTISLAGVITQQPIYSHEVHGRKFYDFVLSAKRTSGVVDSLVCRITEEMLPDLAKKYKVLVEGEIRSFNSRSKDGKSHLEIFVFVKQVHEYEGVDDNRVKLEGTICKAPVYRKTPLGRKITDLLIANNYSYTRSSYIPVIAWGRDAHSTATCQVGDHVSIVGRLQSREYIKKLRDGIEEVKVAYELSVRDIDKGND